MVNFEDSKYKTKNDIINALDNDGKFVFSKEEKGLFIDYSIKTVKEAKEVAKLILKSKEAKKKRKEDDELKKYLEGERFKNSLAYQIVNKKNEMVDEAIDWLRLLIVTDDSPKNKDERKKRKDEINLEIKKKEKEQGEIGRKITAFKREKRKKVLEKQREEKSLSRRDGLIILLSAAGKDNATEITNKSGGKVKLSDTFELNDYSYVDNSYDGMSTDESLNPILKKSDDSSIPKDTKTVKEWVQLANGFLNNIINENWKEDIRTFRHTNLKYNMGREWNSKHNIQCVEDAMGYSCLCVLRRIGDEKLIKVIDEKNPSNKDDLKEFVKRYFGKGDECSISPWERKFGRTWRETEEEGFAEMHLEKVRAWNKSVLKIENDDYPYVYIPDYKKLFEFMYAIFPVDGTSRKLIYQTYLDKKDSSNFLEAKLGEWKDDWDEEELELFVDGHKTKPPVRSASDTDKKNHNLEYTKDTVTKILPGTSFKDLIQMWWDEFSPFLDDNTKYWKDNNPDSDYSNKSTLREITGEDSKRANALEQIRYARTMRELAFKIGLSDEIDEFDSYILDIADEAEDIAAKKWIKDGLTDKKEEILKIKDSFSYGGDEQTNPRALIFYKYRKALLEKDLLSNKTKLDEIILAAQLNEDSRNEVAFLEAEIKRIDDEINRLTADELNLRLEIASLRMEEESLRDDDEFEEEDLPGKIKKFNELYGKKDEQGGKWTWKQIRTLQERLRIIKKEMNDDARFKREEFEKKQKEVDEIEKKVTEGGFTTIINQDWLTVKAKKGSLTEAIKEIDKTKDETGISWKTIADAFEGLANHVKLEDMQQNDWDELNKAIKEPEKYKDEPQEKEIELADFKAISVFANADKDLLKKWKDLPDSKGKYKKKSAIESLINRVVGDTSKKGKFVEHIKDDPNIGTGSDDEKLGNFFTKTEPKKVIETILTHEKLDTDDKKNTEKENVKKWSEGSGDSKKVLNMKEYGSDKEDGEPSDEGVLKFLYEEEIGADHKTRNASEKKDDSSNEGENGKGVLAHLKANWHWYGLAILAIIALLVVIFWKNISEWWNGPAEEEGKGAEDNEEEEKENE